MFCCTLPAQAHLVRVSIFLCGTRERLPEKRQGLRARSPLAFANCSSDLKLLKILVLSLKYEFICQGVENTLALGSRHYLHAYDLRDTTVVSKTTYIFCPLKVHNSWV